MSFFDWLLGDKNKDDSSSSDPSIRFGRHSGYYKSSTQHNAWDAALNAFEEGNYMESYRKLFEYLGAGTTNCVQTTEHDDNSISFEIQQGSKRILGKADVKSVRAEIDIAQAETLNVAFMRRLMEYNNGLTYGRFALDDANHLRMVFDTAAIDASPYKLFYALKEIAVNSDKQDDLLIEQFKMLVPTDTVLKTEIPDDEKQVKYDYIISSIQENFAAIEGNKQLSEQYPGSVTYLLLDLLYRLDYLTCPEGYTMEIFESAHRIYKVHDKAILQKNVGLRKELERLLVRKKEDYFTELYRSDYAFEINPTVSPDAISAYISEELRNTDWYINQNQHKVALAISNTIVGSILFNFTPIKPMRSLLHLYYYIIENKYFENLGFNKKYINDEGQLQAKLIQQAIQAVIQQNKKEYPHLVFDFNKMQYINLAAFAKSYLTQVRDLDFTKPE